VDSGVVVYAGWNNQGYGNLVIVDHANGTWTAYAHLSHLLVTCLQGVTQGQVIAAAGSTGNSTAAHLHFETFRAGAGQVNPWALLPAP
jgi:murein DD-endopeptidase MepM/ murein hydrolase activator NlpD